VAAAVTMMTEVLAVAAGGAFQFSLTIPFGPP
jgi:hypothetical protein